MDFGHSTPSARGLRKALAVCLIGAAVSLLASSSLGAPIKKGLLEELSLPAIPGAKLVGEVNVTPGKLLDDLSREIVGRFGIEQVKQINTLTLSADMTAEEVFKFYEKPFADQQWGVLARAMERSGDGMGLLFNEKKGLLIVALSGSKSGRPETTFIWIQGKINKSKFGAGEKEISDELRKMLGGFAENGGAVTSKSRIPAGRPISVPPSDKLVIKATKSDLKAEILDRNTVEVSLGRGGPSDPGELLRVDDLLVLSLAPTLVVEGIALPGASPIAFDLTDGSLTITAGPKPGDRPVRLSIVSTGAKIALEDFPLVSGTHMVKVLGAEAELGFGRVESGEFVISATGDDVTIMLPKDASASVDVTVSNGRIEKLIAAENQKDEPDHLVFRMGAGKAKIAVQAVKGNVTIRPSE